MPLWGGFVLCFRHSNTQSNFANENDVAIASSFMTIADVIETTLSSVKEFQRYPLLRKIIDRKQREKAPTRGKGENSNAAV